jgi:multidrug efflux pump subunit AcrB
MSQETTKAESCAASGHGGIARYFVEHREVAWVALVAVLVWGAFSYTLLPQQEDPTIPKRIAMLVTQFPGASPQKVEELVTEKLEEKIAELDSIEEIRSQSRSGVSVIKIVQNPASKAVVLQEWDRIRAKMREATLPDGCGQPYLNTDFGNTITLLLGITSPAMSRAELEARARPIRQAIATLRDAKSAAGRASVFCTFPPAIDDAYRTGLMRDFSAGLESSGLVSDVRSHQGRSFILAEFALRGSRADVAQWIKQFIRKRVGTDSEPHPDFAGPLLLCDTEDPLPALKALNPARYTHRELEIVADRLKDNLKQIDSVGKVQKIGDIPEIVYLLYSIATVNGFPMSVEEVLNAVAARNAVIPGGTLSSEGRNFPVQLSGEFADEQQMLGTIVGVADNKMPVHLRDVLEVRRGYPDPVPFRADVLQRDRASGGLVENRSVLLAVEMKDGQIIGKFRDQVAAMLEQSRELLPEGVGVVTLSDQPAAVVKRIRHFIECFIEAVVVVVIMSLFLMEWRSALLVALAIPLTISMTLGGMAILGIPLHQISIASLIIALGMLVDDPVVASDAINRELAHNNPRGLAAWFGPYRLRRPIFFGTIINIVAFLPLVLLPGDKGVFIWALPAVVTLSLISSRIVSMTFVPLLGYYLLRGQKGFEAGGETRTFLPFRLVDLGLQRMLPRYRALLQSALNHPFRAIGIAYGLLALSFLLTPLFGTQFFPAAERNQFLIDIKLPESSSVVQTREACREVVEQLGKHPEIVTAAVFSGGTAPRFYYNVVPDEPGSSLAQVLVNTRTDREVPALLAKLRKELDRNIAGARCIVKQLEQGPPVETPIQIRLTGPDLDTLREKADQVASILRADGGYHVHDDLGRRLPTLMIDIDQDRANTLFINNQLVGRLAQSAFAGVRVTELREGDHLIPVLVRLRAEERNEADKIRTLYVKTPVGGLVPVESFATVSNRMEYSTIAHFNKLRSVTVKSYSAFNELPSAVVKRARQAIRAIGLPPGYTLEFAGEDRELRKSRNEMSGVMAISLGLIMLAMVIQFHSAIKSLVVMLTVPLGLIGAFLGIALTHASFGFMAFLGIVSLAGVIVSHIIVLSDFIEEARAEGMELKQALVQAGLVRLRAVLVTVLATVGGLIPLTLTGGELWLPLTSVHIFGLLLATALTLVLLPVLYYVFCARLKWIR